MNDVIAIIVTYNSDLIRLNATLESLSQQAHIVVCDNSEDAQSVASIKALAKRLNIYYLPMPSNVGVAAAQNAGILFSKQFSPKYFLLMDDDSIPAPDLISSLLYAYHKLSSRGVSVGSVGARAFDPNGIDVSTTKASNNEFDKCVNMMNSGALIPSVAIDDVGLMDESLFIDCVDFEWGWRAQQKKYELYLVNAAVIEHLLGDKSFQFLGIRKGVPSPIRHYYQFRNILNMLFKNYVPIRWRIKQFFFLFMKLLFFSVFVKPRLSRLTFMLRGVRDWALRKKGRI